MSHQSESERPRKRTKILQIALGFDTERQDDHCLLSNVLAFIASSQDLARTRQVCRSFRKCSDEIASAQTTAFIGGSVKPMIGQSIVGLLHAAEAADDRTRRALKEDLNPSFRKQGFDIGLPTKKEEKEYRNFHILATIPCDPVVPGANVPVKLELNYNFKSENFRGTLPRLPEGFFHMNVSPCGMFHPCDTAHEIPLERNLNDTLDRIKRDLFREDTGCPHSLVAYQLYSHGRLGGRVMDPADIIEDLPLYKEYATMCMNVYFGYKLGQPFPKLDLFQKLLETKMELLETKTENNRLRKELEISSDNDSSSGSGNDNY